MADALVIGAGVIGLTSAICLAESGMEVRIVAAAPPQETTSRAGCSPRAAPRRAAGLHLPGRGGPSRTRASRSSSWRSRRLRPARPDVRLEEEPLGSSRCVHNYGHGGTGLALAWGCARDVVDLVARA